MNIILKNCRKSTEMCYILKVLSWWICNYCFCSLTYRAWICNSSIHPLLWAHCSSYLFPLTNSKILIVCLNLHIPGVLPRIPQLTALESVIQRTLRCLVYTALWSTLMNFVHRLGVFSQMKGGHINECNFHYLWLKLTSHSIVGFSNPGVLIAKRISKKGVLNFY